MAIDYLLRYLEVQIAKDADFPWNRLTCLVAVSYVKKKKHESSHTFTNLDRAAEQYLYEEGSPEIISELFANYFIPEAQIHFTVPELDDLCDKDKSLNRNEILAGFLEFLFQILYREILVDTAREQRYLPLAKALTFLLAVLGDKPFDCNFLHGGIEEQLKDILTESEELANEAGGFIYSCVFSSRLVEEDMFNAERSALLEKFEILNINIRQHCVKFSELPVHDVPMSDVVDSFPIIRSLIDYLDDFWPHEVFLVNDQIVILHDELRNSQAVLEFIEARQGYGAMKEPLGLIRDLAYEAEYLINSDVAGLIHAWYLDLRLPAINQKIKFALVRLEHVKELQPSQVMIRYGGEVSDGTPSAAVDDNHFVELQDSTTERILDDLVGNQKSCREIISIFGMPGLGKTTIADKLYNCSSASDYFDRRVWCVVSQTYSERSLLINISIQVAGELKKDEILIKSDQDLRQYIYQNLKLRRYLIVLDDIWDSNAWYDLQRYLPDDQNGSRVILTSRIKDVAPDGSIYHTLPLFTDDQCWDLLEKKTFRGKSCPPELVNIGKRIAAKCSGIPLAVVVTAGILANLKREEDAWEKQLDVFLSDSLSDYRKILELSYEHLPHNMKSCFLYFAAFPEDAEISVNKLAWRWMAEGFIRKKEGKSREQIADLYFYELINRSLVIPGKRGSDGTIKKCRIHDLLRDICVMKANEEKFLNSKSELSIYEKHQRSYLSSTSNTPFGLQCRSLIGGLPHRSSCFQIRPLLKVLDIRPNKFQEFYPRSFDLPVQLRYLGVNHLTDLMVANLHNLEVINVVNSRQIKVPSIVLRMKKLRHLIIKKDATFEDDVGISETTNLRTLLYVCIHKRQDEAIWRCSPHLQKLKINVSGQRISLDLSFLEKLETLRINNIVCRKLSKLNFPSNLKNLCLDRINLPWKKMSVIGRLQKLCVLKLEMNAFVGEEWATVDGEFEELRFLKISQTNLKHWMCCSKHFPKLERLVIEYCLKLHEIPSDLGNISALQKIDVTCCSMRVSLSAIQIEQEQREYGNEEFQVNITNNYWTKQELVALYAQRIENAKNDCKDMYELSSIISSPERDFVVNKDGEQVKVNSLKGKTVGIYFSNFRLNSCRLFNQKLLRVYNELKKHGHFEIVFACSDNLNDELFNADFSKFPWLGIPLADVYTRNKLDELFNIQTIPHLVILDENGVVVTEEGVRIVEEDGRERYPFGLECIPNIKQLKEEEEEKEEDEDKWRDPVESLLVSTTRDYVIDNKRSKIRVSSLVGKTILLLFTPGVNDTLGRMFVPILAQAYQKINEKHNNSLEVIFASVHTNELTFHEFFSTMPWLAFPCDDDRIKTLVVLYRVKSCPKLIVIGSTGNFLTNDGYELILQHGAEAYPFTSERLKEIEDTYDNMATLWARTARVDVHEHELALCKFIPSNYYCDDCGELGYKWAYHCKVCEVSFHPKCALGDDYKAETAESLSKGVDELEDGKMRNDFLEFLLVSESRDYVINAIGTKVSVSNLVGKTIMLFFAGGLCLRNRSFVSKLVQAYQEINEKYNNSVEVIFISDDEETFDKYFAMMPWLALPFNDNRKESLARLYKVKSVPNLVVIGPTGKTLTFDGYKLIMCHGAKAYPFTSERVNEIESENDVMSESWPKEVRKEVHEHELGLVKRKRGYICDGCGEDGWEWSYYCEDCDFDLHPKCALDEDDKVEAKKNVLLESLLFSNSWDYVVDAVGSKILLSNLVGKTIILFFAAQWCPPCRFVLPELLQKYQENNEKHNNCVEVIFISHDKDKSSFSEFFAMMPWLALPFGDYRITSLINLFKTKAIPTLVTIEPTGKTATDNAWELINYPVQDAYPFTYEWVQSQVKSQEMVILWPKKVRVKLHEHELCLVKQILYNCDGCHEVGFDWSYECEVCAFSLHPNCALRDANSEVKVELDDHQ